MTAVDAFFSSLRQHAQRIALDDGSQTLTYDDLQNQIDAWMGRLDDLGAQRVAYCLENGADWVSLDLALLRSDRVAVPIPDFFSEQQIRHVLRATGADTLITNRACQTADGWVEATMTSAWRLLRCTAGGRPDLHSGTAKVTFTSGSTGTPKGVCLSAEHVLGTAAAIRTALGDADIHHHLCILPLSLLLENVAGVYANLGNGNRIGVPYLVDIGISGSSGLDVARFVTAQTDWRPQSIILVPQLLLALTAAAEFGMRLPDSYRFVAVGGGKVPASLIERARAAGIPAFEGYGLTECGSVVALNLPAASRPGSVGRPLGNVAVEAVDGELHVFGSSMLGYLGQKRAASPVATGDLGTVDAEGFVHVSGRRKNGFITAFGRNVSPEWVESELQTELAIGYAAVFGESLAANVALVVPRGEQSGDAIRRAIAAANARLPDYARIAAWRLLEPEAFRRAGCLTANGRLRRDVIITHYQDLLNTLCANVKDRTYDAIRQA
jgi:long-chain acyl-CoA synthetase